MARPQKRTVDYFPHFVVGGKTLLILQNEFGNDGYAFWFKLLSLLCRTDGQVYDYNNPAAWRLLLAETEVSEDIAVKILQLLADIETIDRDLYLANIIWVQHLVDNLADVYRRRMDGAKPTRPVIANGNKENVSRNTQTKQNKTKQNKTIIPGWINRETWDAYIEMRNKQKKPPTAYALEQVIAKLQKLRDDGDDPNEVLNQSIISGWPGVFPVKEAKSGKATRSRDLPRTYTPAPDYPDD